MKRARREIEEIKDICFEHGITVRVKHVRSHSGFYYNEKVDRHCRKILRDYLKHNPK
jgi:hypothetical protein